MDVDLKTLVAEHERNKTPVQDCAVYAAALLLTQGIERLNEMQRNEALDAFRDKNTTNKLYLGVSQMLSVVDRFKVEPTLRRWLLYQVLGKLRGMSRDQIVSWWGEAEVNRIADEIEHGDR